MDKFVLISSPRSGSTTLCRIFESQGYSVCYEPFHPRRNLVYGRDFFDYNVGDYVESLIEKYDCVKQLSGHGNCVDYYLLKNYKTFGLKRRNILQSAVSYAISEKIGIWQKNELIGNEYDNLGTIDINIVKYAINRIKIIDKFDFKYCVYYEDLYGSDGIMILRDIFSYCGCEIRDESAIERLMGVGNKMSDSMIYEKIDNIGEIRKMGSDLLGYL